MKRLFVCNKAMYCHDCPCTKPHDIIDELCQKDMNCGDFRNQKCIRYRHPLEVAIIKELARQRAIRSQPKSITEKAFAIGSLMTLWRVLKEGRK